MKTKMAIRKNIYIYIFFWVFRNSTWPIDAIAG